MKINRLFSMLALVLLSFYSAISAASPSMFFQICNNTSSVNLAYTLSASAGKLAYQSGPNPIPPLSSPSSCTPTNPEEKFGATTTTNNDYGDCDGTLYFYDKATPNNNCKIEYHCSGGEFYFDSPDKPVCNGNLRATLTGKSGDREDTGTYSITTSP